MGRRTKKFEKRCILLCEGYLLESQYFRKFHSQPRVKTRHLNTNHSSLISRSTGAAYL